MKELYFDYNATTPVLPEVLGAMLPCFAQHYGNPSSGHVWGMGAQRRVDQARAQVAGLINCAPGQVVFTSCATESNNLVLQGVLSPGDNLVTSAVEHPAILECAKALEARGVEVTLVPVDEQGLADPAAVEAAMRPNTRLVSLMLANNETGVIQPVAQVAEIAHAHGALMHTDAAQAVAKVPVDVEALGVDLLTIAGHKIYAPKGVGALFVRKAGSVRPITFGGGQEGGLRPGTENVPYMVALGAACALAEDLAREEARQRELGAMLEEGLMSLGVELAILGQGAPRLPNTCCVGFAGLWAGDIISGLVGRSAAVSAGAACHGDTTSVSHVLAAMGVPDRLAHGAVRISWGRPTSAQDVVELVERLGESVRELI